MSELYNNLKNVPIFLWAIPSDEFVHPCVTDVSLVFIRDMARHVTHVVSFNHPDVKQTFDKNEFVNWLNNEHNEKWAFDKKSCCQLLPLTNLLDFNLWYHLMHGKTIDKESLQTNAHKFVYRGKRTCGDLNKTIPYLKHKEMFEKMCEIVEGVDTNLLDGGFLKENSTILETLTELESNGIYVNEPCFKQHFEAGVQPNGLVYSQYNIYTSTGRPSNHFENVNYAALNKENGARKCFTSRYGEDGMVVLIDYSAFHPRIICNLVNFDIPITEDIYKYLGEMYFNRHITDYDLDEIKSITMRQLYGGVEEKYEHIKYFKNLNEFIGKYWKQFSEDGYIWTPIFHRLITTDHLKDANPNKLFNYILQATETEVSMTAVNAVNGYLKDKKTKAVLYTYDSLLFDFHKEDGQETLSTIMRLMQMGERFPIKVYVGDSYDSVKQIYP